MCMKFNVHDIEVEIVGYDDYLKDFDEQALPGFAGEAESLLLEEFEGVDEGMPTYVEFYLEEEKTKIRKNLKFVFTLDEVDCGLVYEYSSFVQE